MAKKKTAVKKTATKKTAAKGTAKKGTAKKSTVRRSTTKRELVDTGTNKMFGKRTATGKFKEMDDVRKSLSADQKKKAKTTVKAGHGDQGDQKTRARKKAR